MNEYQLKELLSNSEKVEDKINSFLTTKQLVKQEVDKAEIKGHIQKAKHNIRFVDDTLKQGYSDWALVGCYYTAYHMALALIMKFGFSSKSHDATLAVIIKHYYQKELDQNDIDFVNDTFLNSQDIMFYAQSKFEREKASYSSQTSFNHKLINEIKLKTTLFLNKTIEIIENGS